MVRRNDFLLGSSFVGRWLDSVLMYRSGSVKTRVNYLQGLAGFVGWCGRSPDELIGLAREDGGAVADLVRGFVGWLVEKGLSRNTVVVYLSCLRSFFKYNDVEVRVRAPMRWVTYCDRAPSKDELREMTIVADLRGKVIISFLAQTGMRQGILAKLRYKDLIWSEEEDPLRIHVPAAISKGRIEYDTFLPSEGVRLLRAYLEKRKRGSRRLPPENITPESPVIRSERTVRGVRAFVLWEEVRKAMSMAGLIDRKVNNGKPGELRPHSLRKFFKTALESAGLSRAYVESLMGHKLPGTDSSYFRPTVTQLREAYKKAEPYLTIIHKSKIEVKNEVMELLKEAAAATRDPEVNRMVDAILEAMAKRR